MEKTKSFAVDNRDSVQPNGLNAFSAGDVHKHDEWPGCNDLIRLDLGVAAIAHHQEVRTAAESKCDAVPHQSHATDNIEADWLLLLNRI